MSAATICSYLHCSTTDLDDVHHLYGFNFFSSVKRGKNQSRMMFRLSSEENFQLLPVVDFDTLHTVADLVLRWNQAPGLCPSSLLAPVPKIRNGPDPIQEVFGSYNNLHLDSSHNSPATCEWSVWKSISSRDVVMQQQKHQYVVQLPTRRHVALGNALFSRCGRELSLKYGISTR